jgi:DNA-binding GntR family transcriptional regulator
MIGQDGQTAPLRPTIALLQGNSLAGLVQHEIERAVLSGELPAGTRLNENTLAVKFGVSRGPIREACRTLAELGLLQLIPNRGVFVRRMGPDDAREVYDLRAGLTGLAASLFCAAATAEQIGYLRQLLDRMEAAAAAPDFKSFSRLNLEFHDFIVRTAGNSRLTKAYRGLVKEFQLFRMHGLVQRDALLTSHAEHCAIVEAIERRDPRRSYETSFAHVTKGKERMLAALATLAGEAAGSPAAAEGA